MSNYKISGTTTGSGFSSVPANPIIPCTIVSARPGVTHRKLWNNPVPPGITAGNDGTNNLDVTFAWRDNFGLPTLASNNAPNFDDYVAGAQTSNPGGNSALLCDVWVVVPIGFNTIRLQSRTFGTCTVGMYIGKSFRYADRVAWNVGGFTTGDIDLTKYTKLCGQWVIAVRMLVCNGYLNGGMYLQMSTNNGVTYADIALANSHGEQPSASSWPN